MQQSRIRSSSSSSAATTNDEWKCDLISFPFPPQYPSPLPPPPPQPTQQLLRRRQWNTRIDWDSVWTESSTSSPLLWRYKYVRRRDTIYSPPRLSSWLVIKCLASSSMDTTITNSISFQSTKSSRFYSFPSISFLFFFYVITSFTRNTKFISRMTVLPLYKNKSVCPRKNVPRQASIDAKGRNMKKKKGMWKEFQNIRRSENWQ